MTQNRTIHKLFWVWDFEKEENWLNGMAQNGWLLQKVGFCTYHFVPCIPGAYTIRLQMHNRDADYLAFLDETGTEYIGRMAQWIYLRRKAENGDFAVFSDMDSKIGHLDKIGKTLLVIGMANVAIGMGNSFHTRLHIGWINLLCATLLMYALGRIHGKKESLKTERFLRE